MPKKSRRQVNRTAAFVPATPARVVEFNPDYTYVKRDLRRVGVLAGGFFVVLIILAFIIH
ncbi:MAG TPA: hypothetical protein VMJ64_14520 [Anaerolineales bacterium]|nr:hypothetical protein [Anaerolineales bacterium]